MTESAVRREDTCADVVAGNLYESSGLVPSPPIEDSCPRTKPDLQALIPLRQKPGHLVGEPQSSGYLGWRLTLAVCSLADRTSLGDGSQVCNRLRPAQLLQSADQFGDVRPTDTSWARSPAAAIVMKPPEPVISELPATLAAHSDSQSQPLTPHNDYDGHD